MHRTLTAALMLLVATAASAQSPASSPLTRLLEAELSRFPARAGVYVKHLSTGEEAGVQADAAFNSFSVIKLAILARAFSMADQQQLRLDERVTLRRELVRDGSGVFQYKDYGLAPTLHDLLTEMVITSDNTATEIMTQKVGGIDALNRWAASAGFPKFQMVQMGWQYRRRLFAAADSRFTDLPAEQITGLMYARANESLFSRYTDLFAGASADLLVTARSEPFGRAYNDARRKYLSEDPAYWLGTMTPREVGRMLEAIENATIVTKVSADDMKAILLRQQIGARRIPHFITLPVAHKTGDGPPYIANDVGIVYARSGPIVISFATASITGPYGELEDMMGRVAKLIVDYFDGR